MILLRGYRLRAFHAFPLAGRIGRAFVRRSARLSTRSLAPVAIGRERLSKWLAAAAAAADAIINMNTAAAPNLASV